MVMKLSVGAKYLEALYFEVKKVEVWMHWLSRKQLSSSSYFSGIGFFVSVGYIPSFVEMPEQTAIVEVGITRLNQTNIILDAVKSFRFKPTIVIVEEIFYYGGKLIRSPDDDQKIWSELAWCTNIKMCLVNGYLSGAHVKHFAPLSCASCICSHMLPVHTQGRR